VRSQPAAYLKDSSGKPVIQHFPVPQRANLVLRGQQLAAVASPDGEYWVQLPSDGDGQEMVIHADTAYFLGEHSADPTRLKAGDELWFEATVPRKGPPRPIRLAIKHNGELQPLPLD